MSGNLWTTSYELRATSYELRATSYELRATSYELRATSYDLEHAESASAAIEQMVIEASPCPQTPVFFFSIAITLFASVSLFIVVHLQQKKNVP